MLHNGVDVCHPTVVPLVCFIYTVHYRRNAAKHIFLLSFSRKVTVSRLLRYVQQLFLAKMILCKVVGWLIRVAKISQVRYLIERERRAEAETTRSRPTSSFPAIAAGGQRRPPSGRVLGYLALRT